MIFISFKIFKIILIWLFSNKKKHCPEWGSNSRPPDYSVFNSDYETDALTNCATEASHIKLNIFFLKLKFHQKKKEKRFNNKDIYSASIKY